MPALRLEGVDCAQLIGPWMIKTQRDDKGESRRVSQLQGGRVGSIVDKVYSLRSRDAYLRVVWWDGMQTLRKRSTVGTLGLHSIGGGVVVVVVDGVVSWDPRCCSQPGGAFSHCCYRVLLGGL